MRSATFPANTEHSASLGDIVPTTVYLLLISGDEYYNATEHVFCGIFSTPNAAIAHGKELTAMIPDYHESDDVIAVYPFTLDQALPVTLSGTSRTWAGKTPPITCSFGPSGIQQDAIWRGRTHRRMFDGSVQLTGVLR